jgi:uncharacterized membrane protein
MKLLRRNQRGQVLVLATLAMVVFMGFAALAVDIGFYYTARRQMQTAADAAAISAAYALRSAGNYTSAGQAASDTAKLNGFTNGQNGITITAAEPTNTLYNTTSYVQVTITQAEPTFFCACSDTIR